MIQHGLSANLETVVNATEKRDYSEAFDPETWQADDTFDHDDDIH